MYHRRAIIGNSRNTIDTGGRRADYFIVNAHIALTYEYLRRVLWTMLLDNALTLARLRRRLPPPEARRVLRVSSGVSQSVIAREIGVDRATVSRWETGERSPRAVHLEPYIRLLERLASEDLSV